MKIIIVTPVYNEELILAKNITALLDYCRQNLPVDDFTIIISDNNSQDKTQAIGKELSHVNPEVDYFFLPEKGKGLAIKRAWDSVSGDIYVFMDIDLSVKLEALKPLIDAIKGGADMAIASRFHPQSKVDRSFGRRIFSYGYRLTAKTLLKLQANDLPCGFKAINHQVKTKVVPMVIDDRSWFFDSELLILTEKMGHQIAEIPVYWSAYTAPGRKSRLNILDTTFKYFTKILGVRKRLKQQKML